MQLQDSYKALAASIERALRAEIPPSPDVPRVLASVEDVLLREACDGERKLAYLRLATAAGTAALALWTLFFQPAAASASRGNWDLALRCTWMLLALGLAFALRRGWYEPRIRYVAPAVDALVIWGIILLLSNPANPAPLSLEVFGVETSLCGFLAISGTLRLSRGSAQISTLLAIALFLFAAAAGHAPIMTRIVFGFGLLTLGALSIAMATLVRRVATNEVKRLVFSQMYERAQEAVDAREEVLKIVSHDLRNPLNTISMCASLMIDVPLPDDARTKHLRTIKRAGERMNRMIQDLLDVAKLEARRLGISPKPLQLSALLAEAEEMLKPLAAERSLTLEVIAPPTLPTITADGGRLLQLLSNLVGNAIKFTAPGGRITIRVENTNEPLVFSVADTGAGIPAEQLDRVFGHFWQGNPGDRRGIGLGLAISKGIVEAHGGRIWVESEVGRGTTFFFTLAPGLTPSLPAPGEVERRKSLG